MEGAADMMGNQMKSAYGGPNSSMSASVAPPMAPEASPVTHDVTIKTTKKLAQAKVMGVPPEEFGIERGARDIKTCNYCFHDIVTKTEADLIAEGYDEEQVKSLISPNTNSTESQARDSVNESNGLAEFTSGTRPVKYTEHFIRMDYEGTGRACLYMVVTGGDQGEILLKGKKEAIYPIDAMPFAAVTPVPIPHRFFGRSIADLVMDIQRIKTALIRGVLDNAYMVTEPRMEIAESHAGPNTIDDLLVSRRNGLIRTKTPGGLQSIQTPPIGQYLMPVMDYMDSTREMRTGVTRQGQGVDANALQNQSATAVNQVFTMAQARMKLIARIIAETGVKDIFSLLHGVIRKHGSKKETARLRNKWVPIDPRQWKTRQDMTINVGLGNGGKAEQFAQMMGIANVQKEMVAGGLTHVVDAKKLYNTASQLVKISGHKNADQFFNDPDEKAEDGKSLKYPPLPPQPPEAVQVAQIKAQTDQQALQVQAQLDEQADQRKAQIETVQAQADMATTERKMQGEMVMSEREFELKRELALLQASIDKEKFEREEARKEREHAANMEMQREQHQQMMASGAFKVVQGQESHEQKLEQMKAKPAAKPKGDK